MEIRNGNKSYDVYTKATADKLGIEYNVDWRTAEPDQWFLTSDNMVLKCLKRLNYTSGKKKSHLIVTCFGDTPTTKKRIVAKSTGKKYRSTTTGTPTYVRDIGVTAKQDFFIQNLINNSKVGEDGVFDADSVIKAYMSVFKDNNPENSLKRATMIMGKKSVKERMAVLMKDKFEAIGLDDTYLANAYKRFIEDADSPPAVRLNALNKVTELSGHNKKEKTVEKTIVGLTENDRKLLIEHRKELSQKKIDKYLSMDEIKINSMGEKN